MTFFFSATYYHSCLILSASCDRVQAQLPIFQSTTHLIILSFYVHFRRVGAGYMDPLAACSIISKQAKGKVRDMSSLRRAAIEHQKYVKGAILYPLEHDPGHGQLCTVPSRQS